MIKRTTTRLTIEDKSLNPAEIYREKVFIEIRFCGLLIFKSHDKYECTPSNCKQGKIGYK